MSNTPQVNFSQLVVSYAQAAFVALGEIPHPETQQAEPNLPAAQHALQILEILQSKTTGNLDEQEQKLMETLLNELRGKLASPAAG